jgi:ribosome-binding factor A
LYDTINSYWEVRIKERRQKKLEHVVRKEVEEIIRRHLSDANIGFITITCVDITADLKQARIGVSLMGGSEEKENSFNELIEATPYIQHKLAGRLVIRRAPKIEFVFDEGREFRVEELLEELRRERDAKNSEGIS